VIVQNDALEEGRRFWDTHAARDPLWAILSDPAKKDARWDLGQFFQTGVAEVSALLYEIDSHGIALARGAALDFGCGVGRLTQALAEYFDRVVGVDISPRMLELANELNRTPARVSYVWNQSADLNLFSSNTFDFVVTNVVLQHVEPEIVRAYLAEFLRVLLPDGLVVFQLPSHLRADADRPPAPIASAMADEAYRAWIRIVDAPARPLRPGSVLTITVEVTNRSAVTWSQHASGIIRVGNHWTDSDGRMLQRDDGRSDLPMVLGPGETTRLRLTITVPGEETDYRCEVDLAHEGVLWFGDRGNPVASFTVRATNSDERDESFVAAQESRAHQPREIERGRVLSGPNLAAADPGEFPMHGIPRESVERLIAESGGVVVHVEHDRSCGDDWVSYRYFVRRRGGPAR
jgi:SAM-dependent methyltransferase